MASSRGKVNGTVGNITLSTMLRQRLRSEGIKDVEINANSVGVPGGRLMATFTLSFPQSLPDDRRLKMERLALEECASYLQAPRSLETSPNETSREPRAIGSLLKEMKI